MQTYLQYRTLAEISRSNAAGKDAVLAAKVQQLNEAHKAIITTNDTNPRATHRVKTLKKELAENGVIVRLSSDAYDNVTSEALGPYHLSTEHLVLLAKLNYWVQDCGDPLGDKPSGHAGNGDAVAIIVDLKDQLDSVGIDIEWLGGIYHVTSVKRRESLTRLAEMYEKYGWDFEHCMNRSREELTQIRNEVLEIRVELRRESSIPVRQGNKFLDLRNVAMQHRGDLSDRIKHILAQINLAEYQMRIPMVLDKIRPNMPNREAKNRMELGKTVLLNEGITLELDSDLHIWRIADHQPLITNVIHLINPSK